MSALAKFNQRIASRDVRTSTRIRAELEQIKQPQQASEMWAALSQRRAELAHVIGEERGAADRELAALEADVRAFEVKHEKAFARHAGLSAELTIAVRTEAHRLIDDLYQQFITDDAKAWATCCKVYEAMLIERAARATAFDELARMTGAPERHLAVGFPSAINHPDSVNEPSLARNRERREIYQAVGQRAAELRAELLADLHA
jgi:hypothetical protein